MQFEILDRWLQERQLSLDLLQLRDQHPLVVAAAEREALQFWKAVDKAQPRYDTSTPSQSEFLNEVAVPVAEFSAPHRVVLAANGHPLGRFVRSDGMHVTVEEWVASEARDAGWRVYECERRLIRGLVAVLLAPVFLDSTDSQLRTGYRKSTLGRTGAMFGMVPIPLPDDFGTRAFGTRRRAALDARLAELATRDISTEFENLLEFSLPIRDYLSVNDVEIEFVRAVLAEIPAVTVLTALSWTAEHFWERQAGWPDLVVVRRGKLYFVEVKSKNDRLSEEQMRWFRWAVLEARIPCCVVKVHQAGAA